MANEITGLGRRIKGTRLPYISRADKKQGLRTGLSLQWEPELTSAIQRSDCRMPNAHSLCAQLVHITSSFHRVLGKKKKPHIQADASELAAELGSKSAGWGQASGT